MSDAPRRPHGYWVILAGNTPTSFRARTRDLLVPTFVQLQRTQPDVSLKWFERSRIWTSPAEALAALLAQRHQPRRREHPPDWRPGGDHKDPRKRFELSRDQKRARFKARQRVGPPREGSGSSQDPRRPDRQGAGKPWQNRPDGGVQRPGAGKAGSGGRWPVREGSHPPSGGSGTRRPSGRTGGTGRAGPRKPGGGSRGPR